MSLEPVSVSRVISAAPEQIFELLVDPSRHHEIDGSGTVQASREPSSTRLALGTRFGMQMKLGVPYPITNTVVEFEENRLIAWRHVGGHRWRWELEPVPGGTRVTETFDPTTSRLAPMLRLIAAPSRNAAAIEASLDLLQARFSRDLDADA